MQCWRWLGFQVHEDWLALNEIFLQWKEFEIKVNGPRKVGSTRVHIVGSALISIRQCWHLGAYPKIWVDLTKSGV
jgi:hypothetical protein